MQWGVLVWLGVVASGLGYFMWNYGATQVDAGTLGIMNNVHVPAGLLVNLAIWQQQPHWPSFLIGGGDHGFAVGPSPMGRSALRTNGRWSHAWFRAERINASVIG